MILFKTALRVWGWHFGGSYRSAELWKAPGTIFSKRSGDIRVVDEVKFAVYTVGVPFSKLEPMLNAPP